MQTAEAEKVWKRMKDEHLSAIEEDEASFREKNIGPGQLGRVSYPSLLRTKSYREVALATRSIALLTARDMCVY